MMASNMPDYALLIGIWDPGAQWIFEFRSAKSPAPGGAGFNSIAYRDFLQKYQSVHS